jgi:ankyrin repeat protein
MLACFFGNFLFVKLLLENGASIDAMDPISYRTALTIAINIYRENIDIIHILLENGSNPNQYICEYLYEKEEYDKESGGTADEEFKCRWKSSLLIAIDKITKNEENKIKIIELLLNFGADINSQYEKHMLEKDNYFPFKNETEFRNFWGIYKVRTYPLLSYVINNPFIKDELIQVNMIKLFIQRNADINYIDPDNKTALEYICSKNIIKSNKLEIIKDLVEFGAYLEHGSILESIELNCSNTIKKFIKEYREKKIILK